MGQPVTSLLYFAGMVPGIHFTQVGSAPELAIFEEILFLSCLLTSSIFINKKTIICGISPLSSRSYLKKNYSIRNKHEYIRHDLRLQWNKYPCRRPIQIGVYIYCNLSVNTAKNLTGMVDINIP
jgi:hypothetical protein